MLYHLGFFFVTVMTALVFGLMGAIVLHVLTDLAHAFTFHIGHIKSLRSWERGHRG